MSMFLRTLLVLVRALRAPRRDVLAESVLRFRVMPGDLDVNVHMNNGRYLALMDLGRFDVIVRAGLYRPRSHVRRWPLIGSAMIRFRRSLQPFSRFELRTRVLGWDDRWFVFEQRFEQDGQVVCSGLARGLFRTPRGSLAPGDLLREGGFPTESPPLPEHVIGWARADDQAYAAAVKASPG
jgi:acyl-CoA thioesterase FadM